MDPIRKEQPLSPIAELEALCARLRACGRHETVNGSLVKELLDAARRIEAVHRTAAEMQLGAEGFDNAEAAALYRGVQQHLLAAAREVAAASAALIQEEERWASVKR